MFSVILERGDLGNKVWDDVSEKRAASRAASLAELHGNVGVTVARSGDDVTLIVHAAEWYR